MSFLDRVRGERATIQNPDTPLTSPAILSYLGGTPTWSGASVNPQSALTMSAVWACTKIYTDTIGSLPLKLHRRKKDGGKELAVDHPLYDVLHSQSNGEMFALLFREVLQGHALGWGNAYAEIQRNNFGQVVGLWPLLPNRTRCERRDGKKVVLTWIKEKGGSEHEVTLPASLVFHMPGLGFDGLHGYSPIQIARQAIGMGLAAEEFTSRFFSNGAHLGMVLEHPEKLSPQAKESIRTEFEILHQGLSQAHRVAVLEEGMKANKLALSPKDAQLIELMRFSVAQIARFYGVPLVLLEETEKATSWGTGIEQFMLGWVMHRLRPWLVRWEQAINSQLLTAEERQTYFAEFSIEGLLRGDSKARGEFFGALFQVGALSPNQILETNNMDGIGPDGDRHFVPMNMIPLDQVGVVAVGGDGGGDGVDGEGEEGKAAPAPRRGVELRRERAALWRQRVRAMLLPIFEQACGRVVRREVAHARKVLAKAGDGGLAVFVRDMEEFYDGLAESVWRELTPAVESLGEAVRQGIEDETGAEVPVGAQTAWAKVVGAAHVEQSRQELAAAVAAGADLEALLDAWEKGRGRAEATEFVVRVGEALARAAYAAAGISGQWRLTGDCPLGTHETMHPGAGPVLRYVWLPGCRCIIVAA